MDNSFFPYKKGMPSFAGLTPGMTINKANVDQFKEALAAGTYKIIKDGYFEMKVGPDHRFRAAADLHRRHTQESQQDQAGRQARRDIDGFVAGRPFPEEPDAKDPRAGEKLAWNFKYGLNWGDNAAINPIYFKYRNMVTGQIEKTIKGRAPLPQLQASHQGCAGAGSDAQSVQPVSRHLLQGRRAARTSRTPSS